MKKIIWIFGQHGSGRSTLIKNILENNNNIREELGITADKIAVSSEQPKISLLQNIHDFINSDEEVLLIKGTVKDMEYIYYNNLKQVANNFPELEKELYLLEVEDLDLLYERLTNTEWFKSNLEENMERFPRNWLDIAVKYMNTTINNYTEYGYQVTEIDTTDGYSINKSAVKNRKN